MSWSTIVKNLKDEDLDNFKNFNNKKIEEEKVDYEPKPEDFFKNFEDEFDDKYNLTIFDIYYDIKKIIEENNYNLKIDFDDI